MLLFQPARIGAQNRHPRSAASDSHGCLLRSSPSSESFLHLISKSHPNQFLDGVKSMSLWEETIHGGASWSLILRRGNMLRLEDIEGGANVGALFYNRDFPVERYNMPDTLKAQHTAHLTQGFVLYSDMGRVLCSITDDTCGWHDPLGGHNDARRRRREVRRGELSGSPQRLASQHARQLPHGSRKVRARCCATSAPNVNFFSKVVVRERRLDGVSCRAIRRPGDFVELRAEMNLLVILDTGQHPLDPNPEYAPKPVKFSVSQSAAGCRGRSVPHFASGKRTRLHQHGKVFPVTREQADAGRRFYNETVLAGDYWIHEIKAGQSSASWIWKATRRWTRCSTTRTILRNATARPTRSWGSATSI